MVPFVHSRSFRPVKRVNLGSIFTLSVTDFVTRLEISSAYVKGLDWTSFWLLLDCTAPKTAIRNWILELTGSDRQWDGMAELCSRGTADTASGLFKSMFYHLPSADGGLFPITDGFDFFFNFFF